MPVTFPINPTINDTFTFDGRTYIWDGEKWAASSTTGPAGPGVPVGGNTDDLLFKDSATDFDTSWRPSTFLDSSIKTRFESVDNLVLDVNSTDNATLVRINPTVSATVTLSTAPIGFQVMICRLSTDDKPVTFVADTGQTILSSNNSVAIGSQYGVASAIKLTTDDWLVFGDIV